MKVEPKVCAASRSLPEYQAKKSGPCLFHEGARLVAGRYGVPRRPAVDSRI